MNVLDEKYSVEAIYYDKYADLERKYIVGVYLKDNSVEMYDVKNRRQFLKRTKDTGVTVSDLIIGNTIVVNSRQLRITDYADEYTKIHLLKAAEDSFVMCIPAISLGVGSLIHVLEQQMLTIVWIKTFLFEESLAKTILGTEDPRILNRCVDKPVVAMRLTGSSSIDLSNNAVFGSDVPSSEDAPSIFLSQGVFISNTVGSALSCIKLVEDAPTWYARDSTSRTVIIKPHMIKSGKLGELLELFENLEDQGMMVTSIMTGKLATCDCEELLEVYYSVVVEYLDCVNELSNGLSILLEITSSPSSTSRVDTGISNDPMNLGGNDVGEVLRGLAGPIEPLIARTLAKDSLRARYGNSIPENCVHVCELEEDEIRERELLYRIYE